MRGTIHVHRSLTERNVPHEFYRLKRPLRNIDEAAALLGLRPADVVVAELFETKASLVLALVPADVCASASEIADAVGSSRVRPAPPSRVREQTGFMPHWLPPLGHERESRTLIDSVLLQTDVVYAPGGDPGVMLVLRSVDLLRATAATVASLAATEFVPDVPVPAFPSEGAAAGALG